MFSEAILHLYAPAQCQTQYCNDYTCNLKAPACYFQIHKKVTEPLWSELSVRQLDGQQIKILKRISANKAVASKEVPGLNFSTVCPRGKTKM